MNLSTKLTGGLGACVGVAALASVTLSGAWHPSGSQDGIQVGETAAYQFRSAPTNARGIRNLEDLRGRPVLIDFWGTR